MQVFCRSVLRRMGCEVGKRACQTVDLVDYHQIDQPRRDVGKQTLERRALNGRPGEAAIGIRGADELPALMGLTLYVSLSRLALGIKTIEVLFEPVLGGFAGIDSAAQHPPLRGHRSAPASQRTWAHSTSFPCWPGRCRR